MRNSITLGQQTFNTLQRLGYHNAHGTYWTKGVSFQLRKPYVAADLGVAIIPKTDNNKGRVWIGFSIKKKKSLSTNIAFNYPETFSNIRFQKALASNFQSLNSGKYRKVKLEWNSSFEALHFVMDANTTNRESQEMKLDNFMQAFRTTLIQFNMNELASLFDKRTETVLA